MKNINKLTSFSFLTGVLLTMSACEKEDALLPEKTTNPSTSSVVQAAALLGQDYTVVNGRLTFRDSAAFWQVVNFLQQNKGTLEKWDQENTVTSLQESYNSINQRVAAVDAGYDNLSKQQRSALKVELSVAERAAQGTILWIPDRVFASILNADGEYQVGRQVYKVTQQNVYAVDAAKESLLRKKDLQNPAVAVTAVKYSVPAKARTTGGLSTNPTGEVSTNRVGHFEMWYTDYTEYADGGGKLPETHNGRPTRLWVSQWNVVWGGYASHGVRTQFEYKSRLAGWLDNNAEQIYVQGESVIIRPNDDSRTQYYVTNEDMKTNDDVVEATLQSHASVEFMEIVWSNSQHWAVYKGATARLGL